MSDEIQHKIREVLAAHARLPVGAADGLAPTDDLFQAGMTSHASVNVMLGLEDAFDVEFPDEMLTRRSFESIAAISASILQLRSAVA